MKNIFKIFIGLFFLLTNMTYANIDVEYWIDWLLVDDVSNKDIYLWEPISLIMPNWTSDVFAPSSLFVIMKDELNNDICLSWINSNCISTYIPNSVWLKTITYYLIDWNSESRLTNSKTFTINIHYPLPTLPLSSTLNKSFIIGQNINVNIIAIDSSYTYLISWLPDWLSFNSNNWNLIWIPTTQWIYNITLTKTNLEWVSTSVNFDIVINSATADFSLISVSNMISPIDSWDSPIWSIVNWNTFTLWFDNSINMEMYLYQNWTENPYIYIYLECIIENYWI